MTRHATFKTRLRRVRDGTPPSGDERADLLATMTDHLGSTDPELRDELIYRILANWVAEDVLTDAEVRDLLETCLDNNHLFLNLGARGDDSVFTRSFSVLYVAVALYRHNRTPFLSEKTVETVEERLLEYTEGERDRRGYVDEKGWAHAPAHLADALDELAQCSMVGADGLEAILGAIRTQATTPETIYVDGEDDRLVTAVLSVAERGVLDEAVLERWVASLGDLERVDDGGWPVDNQAMTNAKAVLGSLYCRSVDADVPESLRHRVLETRAELAGIE